MPSHTTFLNKMIETFGANWSYEMSRRTNLNARTLERMAAGEKELPSPVERLGDLLHETRDFWQRGIK